MQGGKRLSLLFFFLVLIGVCPVFSQKSKSQLEKEKKETLQKIKDAEKILSQTASQKKASLGQLSALNNQIEQQQNLITSIQSEVSMLNGQIGEINSIVESMEEDLKKLKEEYSAMVYSAYKSSKSQDKLSFLFSAKNFNQLAMRLKYMEQYGEARRNQVAQIEKVKQALDQQRADIQEKKKEKSNLLFEQIKENDNLQALKVKQSDVVKNLSERESEIRKELTLRKNAVENLENLIAELVRREIEKSIAEKKAKEAAAKKKADEEARLANKNKDKSKKPSAKVEASASNKIALTPETEQLSSSFAANKGRLAWPVASGFISGKFGTHPHPVLKHVTVRNDGVDIQTNQNEQIRVVSDGVVSRIAFAPGMNNVVIISHGDYFTVYARLKDVNVKGGQTVKAKDIIGTVYTDKEGTAELQFQIWKNEEKLNPQGWLLSK